MQICSLNLPTKMVQYSQFLLRERFHRKIGKQILRCGIGDFKGCKPKSQRRFFPVKSMCNDLVCSMKLNGTQEGLVATHDKVKAVLHDQAEQFPGWVASVKSNQNSIGGKLFQLVQMLFGKSSFSASARRAGGRYWLSEHQSDCECFLNPVNSNVFHQ